MDPVLLRQRLETARRTFDTLERQLADPAVAADPARLQAIAREFTILLSSSVWSLSATPRGVC